MKQLDFTWFVGDPVYLATQDPQHTRIIPVNGPPAEQFDTDRIVQVLKLASRPTGLAEVRVLREYDAYYEDRLREKPLPVIPARLETRDKRNLHRPKNGTSCRRLQFPLVDEPLAVPRLALSGLSVAVQAPPGAGHCGAFVAGSAARRFV